MRLTDKQIANTEEKVLCLIGKVVHFLFPFMFHKYIDEFAMHLGCSSYTVDMHFRDSMFQCDYILHL